MKNSQKSMMNQAGQAIKTSVQQPALGPIRVALVCGGPSLERGISLNSARSVIDHLLRQEVVVNPYYVDIYKNFYRLSVAQLYSNTPSDFDFKLHATAHKLTKTEFFDELRHHHIVFPVIHGSFGEDGEFQAMLEKEGIPHIGSGSTSCQMCFGKHIASTHLHQNGFSTLPSKVLSKNSDSLEKTICDFFETHHLNRVVVKPIYGGSSIGVFSAYSPKEACEKVQLLFQGSYGNEALLEPFCSGKEFTVIILQNPDGNPVALIPTEIQVNYDGGGIFDYRRKYLPTANTIWFCPPRFEDHIVEKIRRQAEELFRLFQMRDFARIDGWLLDDGTILFTDFNPLSGMEQNSFIFQQASRIGLTHEDLLWNILSNALRREKIPFVDLPAVQSHSKESVHVLFGGKTAERQVSLMTGTNVWLKLKKSDLYTPEPYLLDRNGYVWHLPYTYSLNHTVEEISEHCQDSEHSAERIDGFLDDIKRRLSYAPAGYSARHHLPKKMTFDEFVELSQKKNSFIFIGLHGGEGENGDIQKRLQKAGLSYNGSDPIASVLCMDKYRTGQEVSLIGSSSIYSVPKKIISFSDIEKWSANDCEQFWHSITTEFATSSCIIKPRTDGCSSGIVRINSAADLFTYAKLVQKRVSSIPAETFQNQKTPIEMPCEYGDDFLIESFIEVDYIRIVKNELVYRLKAGWIELTVGVLEEGGQYHALNPSITVAEGEVLSVEEKFQGGTGVNLTPPPETVISAAQVASIKKAIEDVSKALKIQNYARLDIFYNVKTDVIYIIEANSLPALTPATVIYHQALSEETMMFPRQFLESLVQAAKHK
jgi:D-alanine--D-alanine ligase